MPVALIVFGLVGVAYFATRLVVEPGGWPIHLVGIGACLFVVVRNLTVVRANRTVAASPGFREVADDAALDAVLDADQAVLYKHSTTCPVSATVVDEVLQFARTHPEWPVYLLKIPKFRELSDRAADRLGVDHETPQVLMVKDGHAVWHASHYQITTRALRRHATSEP